MQSLFHLKKSSLTTVAIVGCMVAFTGAASANSVTLSQSGGILGPSTYSVSDTFTVTVYANLGPTGGGQDFVVLSLDYTFSRLTATNCAEAAPLTATFPVPFFGQFVGSGVYSPFTPNCGAGSPGDGGLQTAGLVLEIEQEFTGTGVPATSGTLILGTVTFHAKAPGPSIIASTLVGPGGFTGADFVNRTTGIPPASVSVTVVPEPTNAMLLAAGIIGLLLIGRRRANGGGPDQA